MIIMATTKRVRIIWYESYQVSDEWVVISPFGKILKYWTAKWWYYRCWIGTKQYLIHRIVYCSFNKIPLKFEWQRSNTVIMHINDIPSDNRLCNLKIWTQMDNIKDCISKWRNNKPKVPKEKRHGKINYLISQQIKEDYKKTHNIYVTAKKFWISYATVSRINNNKTWA